MKVPTININVDLLTEAEPGAKAESDAPRFLDLLEAPLPAADPARALPIDDESVMLEEQDLGTGRDLALPWTPDPAVDSFDEPTVEMKIPKTDPDSPAWANAGKRSPAWANAGKSSPALGDKVITEEELPERPDVDVEWTVVASVADPVVSKSAEIMSPPLAGEPVAYADLDGALQSLTRIEVAPPVDVEVEVQPEVKADPRIETPALPVSMLDEIAAFTEDEFAALTTEDNGPPLGSLDNPIPLLDKKRIAAPPVTTGLGQVVQGAEALANTMTELARRGIAEVAESMNVELHKDVARIELDDEGGLSKLEVRWIEDRVRVAATGPVAPVLHANADELAAQLTAAGLSFGGFEGAEDQRAQAELDALEDGFFEDDDDDSEQSDTRANVASNKHSVHA